MSAQEIYDIIDREIDHDDAARQIISQHPEVKIKVNRLKEIKKELEQEGLIKKVQLSQRSKLFGLLNGQGNKLVYAKEDHSKDDIIEKNIFEAYHLTSEILQELGLIDKVDYVFTYIDSKGNYHRVDNLNLNLEMVKLESASSKRGYYSLRLQEAVIKKQMAIKTEDETQMAINEHYQHFVKPFFDYASNNRTGWRVDNKKGILAETFERHWENLHHSIDKGPGQFSDGDIESEGRRWLMFRESSGNAAYYTGPDTVYSQVKNANASLIDNIDTVLNATDAIIELVENNIKISNLAENLKKAFKAAKPKSTFAKNIWNGMTKDLQDSIIEEFAKLEGISTNEVQIKVSKSNIALEVKQV